MLQALSSKDLKNINQLGRDCETVKELPRFGIEAVSQL